MAELMMAVAIIAVLAGVSFIAVGSYFKSMAQLERDGLAKELFVAAQNNLTMAEGQGFLGVDRTETTSFGKKDNSDGSYYYVVNAGSEANGASFDSSTMLGLMLPFGSVDETVRAGGNYIIHYKTDPACVLDVYYCAPESENYGHEFDGDTASEETFKYSQVKQTGGENNKGVRREYHDAVLGWFGDPGLSNLTPTPLADPTLVVTNGDVLSVQVSNYTAGNTIRLIIEGMTSGASGYCDLSSADPVILDDVTTSKFFSHIKTNLGLTPNELTGDKDFIPGEDIRIYAKAINNNAISTIGKSATKITNSLFAAVIEVEDDTTSPKTVSTEISVSSMRHLANLFDANSGMFYVKSTAHPDGIFTPDAVVKDSTKIEVVQTEDLSWNDFLSGGNVGGKSISILDDDGLFDSGSITEKLAEGCWLPVKPSYEFQYDGNNHSISGLKVSNGDAELKVGPSSVNIDSAGLFESINQSGVKNLELINFDISTSYSNGNAGALAGAANTSSIENVLARNDNTFIGTENIHATNGSAGGLFGSVASSNLNLCAASLYVTGKDAGGLVGEVTEANTPVSEIKGCYSGGHVDKTKQNYSDTVYNVIGGTAGVAGGLVGVAGNAQISYSYSTCSVSGKTAGGLIGTGSGNISNCYATGLIKKSEVEGAFAGNYTGNKENCTDCHYYEIINEREKKDASGKITGYEYLGANSTAIDTITPFDGKTTNKSAVENYNDFITKDVNDTPKSSEENVAVPYDEKLGSYYRNVYPFRTVKQLIPSSVTNISVTDDSFVKKHYGDWPAPEIFFINTAS